MGWFSNFIASSLGQKLIMSLSGLFLILYLVIHLAGNLQLLMDDQGRQFNLYAHFMTHNPAIKAISYILYITIVLHAVQGIFLARKNYLARGRGYKIKSSSGTTLASRYMAQLGVIIFVFLIIHMVQFWLPMKQKVLNIASYNDKEVQNLYEPVAASFSQLGTVIFYVISMIVIAYHLWHGFQSAFQTLGLNHKKYTPLIKGLGKIYSILIPALFALIPLYFYFFIK